MTDVLIQTSPKLQIVMQADRAPTTADKTYVMEFSIENADGTVSKARGPEVDFFPGQVWFDLGKRERWVFKGLYGAGAVEDALAMWEPITNGSSVAVGEAGDCLSLDFDHSDLPGGRVVIGRAAKGARVSRVDLIVEEGFDLSVTVTVGDDDDESRLMTEDENAPSFEYVYEKTQDTKYVEETEVALYFTGTSSVGIGHVVVYFG